MGEKMNDLLVISSWEDVDRVGRQLGQLRRTVQAHTTKMEAEIEAVRARWATPIQSLQEKICRLEQAITAYFRAHQGDLGEARTFIGTWVTVKARLCTRLCTLARMTWDKVLRLLKERGLNQFIRVKEEVNKEALKSASLSDKSLRQLGLQIVREDSVTIETV